MKNYILDRTDSDAPSITVDKMTINTDSVDVGLPGRIRLEYGQEVDEALLNILERFSCPNANGTPNVPDLTKTSNKQLHNPTIGQLWFNPLTRRIYSFNGTGWDGYGLRDDYAANWGMIMHGQQIPRPVSDATGRIFDYDECIWSVAPATFLGKVGYVACSTDPDANVTMRYRYAGTSNMVDGQANYLIVALPGSKKKGPYPEPPLPSPTATVTPTRTVTPTPTVSITMTPTMSVTPTPTMSATPTPTPPPSFSPTPVPSPTPSVTPTPAPSQTPAPSPVPAHEYRWVLNASWAGQESYPCRPGDLDTGQAMDLFYQYEQENPCGPDSLGAYYQVNWCDPGSPTSIGYYGFECVIWD